MEELTTEKHGKRMARIPKADAKMEEPLNSCRNFSFFRTTAKIRFFLLDFWNLNLFRILDF
jgi:hypothetical protein